MNKEVLQKLLALLTCFLVMAVVAVNRGGKLFNYDIKGKKEVKKTSKSFSSERVLNDGTIVVNTTSLGKDVKGYGGNVPLEVYIKDNKITKIVALKNSETPEFFFEASSLFKKWIGMPINIVPTQKVDAVSGATFSSRAIIENVKLASIYANKNSVSTSAKSSFSVDIKLIAGLIVVLMAAIIPLVYKNRTMRRVQFVLNIVVLGFWCGTFISYSLIVNYLSNGANIIMALIPIIMLITAFVYPLFGKKNYYCNNICPFGSMQELVGMAHKKKWKLSKKTTKRLELFREMLWAVLMMLMLVGAAFEWMDYEVFSAFMITAASWVVFVIAIVFLILSLFVPRPYCRFVCPTGTLFKVAQSGNVFKL